MWEGVSEVITVRTLSLTKPLIVLVAVASLLMVTAQSSAQQVSGNGNSIIGTTGDISLSKLRPNVVRSFSPRFGPGGLFADAEVFGFSQPRQFVFPLPNFAGAGLDFNGVTFNEYLLLVANSYEVADINDYLFRFSFLNEITAQTPSFIPTQAQVIQIHQNDFLAGGGFLPIPGNPIIPEPILPQPLPGPIIPGDDGPIFDPFPGSPIVPISASSASGSSAPIVASLVPEPATLALVTMGAGLMLKRTRRH